MGEKIFMSHIGIVEQIKLDKIREYADKCVLLNVNGEPRSGVVASAVSKSAIMKPLTAARATKLFLDDSSKRFK